MTELPEDNYTTKVEYPEIAFRVFTFIRQIYGLLAKSET
jgi:hypothetical protein